MPGGIIGSLLGLLDDTGVIGRLVTGSLWFSFSQAWAEPAVGGLELLGDALDESVTELSLDSCGLEAVRGRVGLTEVIIDARGDPASKSGKTWFV